MKVIETPQDLRQITAEMLRDLYPEERRQEILRQLGQHGRVSVAELGQQFGVSEVTIRSDLQALAKRNLVVRTHGGAVPAARGLYDLSLALRRQRQVQEKSRIGEAGATLVADGDAIFLDSSSTALAIAARLKNHHHLTIITNSLAVAQEMGSRLHDPFMTLSFLALPVIPALKLTDKGLVNVNQFEFVPLFKD